MISEPEFDFEAPGVYDGNPLTGPFGADKNGRLTMRDVILARVGHGVRVEHAVGGHFQTLFSPFVAGLIVVHVARGWAATDASVRSTANPLSCCLNTSILTDNFGSVSDFDHQVDHVLTNDPQIALHSSSVTGREPVNGFWDSDHAGLFSQLNIKP